MSLKKLQEGPRFHGTGVMMVVSHHAFARNPKCWNYRYKYTPHPVTHDHPPASACLVLRLQACTTTPSPMPLSDENPASLAVAFRRLTGAQSRKARA